MVPITQIEGSGLLAGAGFEPATGVLRVTFRNGGAYDYQGVTQETYDALMSAESKGKYFGANIRNLKSSRVEEKADAGDV